MDQGRHLGSGALIQHLGSLQLLGIDTGSRDAKRRRPVETFARIRAMIGRRSRTRAALPERRRLGVASRLVLICERSTTPRNFMHSAHMFSDCDFLMMTGMASVGTKPQSLVRKTHRS